MEKTVTKRMTVMVSETTEREETVDVEVCEYSCTSCGAKGEPIILDTRKREDGRYVVSNWRRPEGWFCGGVQKNSGGPWEERHYCPDCTPRIDAALDYKKLERRFHEAGFMDIWYAHPGPRAYDYYLEGERRERFGGRWHAGVFTGPQHDLICVKQCETNEEAERYLSPGAYSIAEAIEAALAKREETVCRPSH